MADKTEAEIAAEEDAEALEEGRRWRSWASWHRSDVPRSEAKEPLSWGVMNVLCFTCPKGHTSMLTEHAVDKNGNLSPSVVCAWPGCDYHEMVTLGGWGE